MLPEPVSLLLVDGSGAPVDGLVPVFLLYKDRLGTNRTQPVVTNTIGGRYWFQPTVADKAAGVVWVLSIPAIFLPVPLSTSTPYVAGSIYDSAYPFLSFFMLDSGGGIVPTLPPLWLYYLDVNGLPTTRPTLTSFAAYLWVALPSDSSLASGIQYAVNTQGAIPAHYSGTLRSSGVPSSPLVASPPFNPQAMKIQTSLVGIVSEKTYLTAVLTQD